MFKIQKSNPIVLVREYKGKSKSLFSDNHLKDDIPFLAPFQLTQKEIFSLVYQPKASYKNCLISFLLLFNSPKKMYKSRRKCSVLPFQFISTSETMHYKILFAPENPNWWWFSKKKIRKWKKRKFFWKKNLRKKLE